MFEPIKFDVQEVLKKSANMFDRCAKCCGQKADGEYYCQKCTDYFRAENEARETKFGIEKYGLKAWEDFTLEGFRQTKENASALAMVKAFNPVTDNLYIFGACGTGKSHLAYGVTRGFPLYDVQIVKQPELMRQFRMIEPAEEEEKLEYFARVKILLIDDLGVGRSTEFVNQVLYEIIDKRLMNRRNGLIVTSNLSMGQFAERCGDDRLSSRLAGICKIVEIGGADWRVKR